MNCVTHSKTIKQQLKGNKLKATPARLGLLDVFEHVKKPLSVTELAQKLGRLGVDKATLYRNVESLEALGLLKKIHLADRQEYYELAGRHHHHHLVCKICGKVSDVEGCKIISTNKNLLKKSGFAKITDHSLEFFGICNNCK
jgi:Fur family ferric uptake transcriptional regulator